MLMNNVIAKFNKICHYCGAELKGRSDKKFCDDYCRNNYYYKINTQRTSYIKRINSVLQHNRKILHYLCGCGRVLVPKQEMDSLGFDYEYFTGLYKTKKGVDYFVVYDYAFSVVNENIVSIVKYLNKV